MANAYEIGKILKKTILGTGLPFFLKKIDRPLIPNRDKLWPKTSDIVFLYPKVLEYRIWAKSEP